MLRRLTASVAAHFLLSHRHRINEVEDRVEPDGRLIPLLFASVLADEYDHRGPRRHTKAIPQLRGHLPRYRISAEPARASFASITSDPFCLAVRGLAC